jgi:hypothetical protein
LTLLVTAVSQVLIAANAPASGLSWDRLGALAAGLGALALLLPGLAQRATRSPAPTLIAGAALVGLLVLPAVWGNLPMLDQAPRNAALPAAGPVDIIDRGRTTDLLPGTESDPKLRELLLREWRAEKFGLVTRTAQEAASIIITTGLPVMAVGGYNGFDPVIGDDRIRQMAELGEVRFFLVEPERPGISPPANDPVRLRWVSSLCERFPIESWRTDGRTVAREFARLDLFDCRAMKLDHP